MSQLGGTAASGDSTAKRPNKLRTALRLLLVNFLLFAMLAEVASVVIVHLHKWPSSRPTYHLSKPFWGDINPAFGIWHYPSQHFFHQGACFTAEYNTNSYGARDHERTRQGASARTVVLGDSFIEGLDSSDHDRLTDTLERVTGVEHLNFGSSGGFSPLQYALVYRTLASGFTHRHVLVGVFPANDFHEMDAAWLGTNYPGQWRPVYGPDLAEHYTGTFHPGSGTDTWDRVESALRGYLASSHVGQYIYGTHFFCHTRDHYSGYNDYSTLDMAKLQKALLDIQSTAHAAGATVDVFLIPAPEDFDRLHANGSNRLGPELTTWGKEHSLPVLDLLPGMQAAAGGNPRALFLPCDAHWSPEGSSIAAQLLLESGRAR